MIRVRPAGAVTDGLCCRVGAMLREEGGGITGWPDSKDVAEATSRTCPHGTGNVRSRSLAETVRAYVVGVEHKNNHTPSLLTRS